MRVLVLGDKGQLGLELFNQLELKGYDVIGLDFDECDITNLKEVVNRVRSYTPNVVVNCAAYTHVDNCEDVVDLAYAVNAIGARNVALATKQVDAKLIHISTDFVFDGQTETPYYEFDEVNPLSIYGKSKLAGERFIKDQMSNFFIIRTSWLYGHRGGNFVKTMLKLSETNSQLTVVSDQNGTPTYVNDLVDVILMMFSSEKYGIYHCSNEGSCTWNEFAKKIFEFAGKEVIVNKINSEEFGAKAIRPAYSVMKKYMLKQEFDYVMPMWEDSLKRYFDNEKLMG